MTWTFVMVRHLLDTNILADLVRNPAGRAARRLAVVGEATVCTSIAVACELRYGASKRGSPALSARIEDLLASLEVLPFDREADRRYAEIRLHLDRIGQPIGPNDLLIAAHALALDLTLVSDNMGEFARIPGLALDNWLAA
jgi:tRNA(fMet)-specific endonuclease VapC